MTDIRFEGLLQKPGRIPGRKTKVWCVLDGKELYFYRENKRSSCIGSLDLAHVRKIEKVVATGSEFQIDCDGRLDVYTAENSVKCDEWIKHISQAIQSSDNSNQQPIAGEANTKYEVKKTPKADDSTASFKSRTESLQPSAEYTSGSRTVANKVSLVKKEVQNKPRVSDKPQRGRISYKKEADLTTNGRLTKHEVVKTVEKNVLAQDLNITKQDYSQIEAVKKSADQTQKNYIKGESCKEKLNNFAKNIDVKHSNSSGKDTETKCDHSKPETPESLKNCKTENDYTSETDVKPNSGNSVIASSFPQTQEKDNRRDSGYETLAGSYNRKSVVTEEYGEVDISHVVMRKSRRSIQSFTMNNSEVEIPKMESGLSLNGPKETNCQSSDKDSSCGRANDENCIQKEECLLSNGDINKHEKSDSDEIYENVNTAKAEVKEKDSSEETANEEDDIVVPMRRSNVSKRNTVTNEKIKDKNTSEETAKEEEDVVVPMRRNIVSKRNTMADVHVPQVVMEADEDDENDTDFTQPSSEGSLLTEEQEDLLMNLTFEPIEELPFTLDDVQNNSLEFSEIQGLVKGSKIQVRNSVSSDENPIESLRKLLDKL